MAFKNELMTEEEKKEFLSHGYRIMPHYNEISCGDYSFWTVDKEKKMFLMWTHKENVMEVDNADKRRTIFLFSVNGKVYYVYLLKEWTDPEAFTWHWCFLENVNDDNVSKEEEQTVKKLIKEALIVFEIDGIPKEYDRVTKQCTYKIDFDF